MTDKGWNGYMYESLSKLRCSPRLLIVHSLSSPVVFYLCCDVVLLCFDCLIVYLLII